MFTRKRTLVLLSLACSSAWSLGAAAETSSFELGSYLDYPGGKQIAARDYGGAIRSASGAKSYAGAIEPLIAATNLCVALTATGAFPDARGACDRALELARREDASARLPTETATSRALSNRGVLRALNGDSTGAASDFRAAAKMKSPWAAAVRNLEFLESSPGRVARAESSAD